MSTPTQFDHDLFRVLLFRNCGRDVLLEFAPNGFRLPVVLIPRHTRAAEEITAAIKSLWNLDTYCLFELPNAVSSGARLRTHIVEVCETHANAPSGMQWLPASSLCSGSFVDAGEYGTIEASLAALENYRTGCLAGAFGRLGWFREVREWVRERASAVGLTLMENFRQLNASPTFSLIRFETNGPALWFKAVGEPNLHEYPITLKLAATFPEFVPKLLGARPDWNAWLAEEADGEELCAGSTQGVWAFAAENLALLQISSFGRRFELIGAGCKDLRPCSLAPLVDPFLTVMSGIMRRQTSQRAEPLSTAELHKLGSDLASSFRELEQSAIPNALGHLDMNPGNVVVSKSRCTFLDWAEAYVGLPFLSFEYLLNHFRRFQGLDRSRERSMRSAYARSWTCFGSWKDIASAFRVTPLLAVFSYAVEGMRWNEPQRGNPETDAYLRALTRRMKRETEKLHERELPCTL